MEGCSTGYYKARYFKNHYFSNRTGHYPGRGNRGLIPVFIAASIHRSLPEKFPLEYTDTASYQLRLHRSEFGKTGADQVAIMRGGGSCVT
jgi:hypothetical protein